MITVADCERVQTEWFRFRAEQRGGVVWNEGGLLWIDAPDGLTLMFPRSISTDAVRQGL